MGSSEIRNLTYKDFVNSVTEYTTFKESEVLKISCMVETLSNIENIIGTWKIIRYKTSMPYITFNSPESTNAILDYLMERERENKGIKNLNDILFVSKNQQKLSAYAHQWLFRQINDKLGFGLRSPKRRFFTSHILRKMFTNALYNAGVDQLAIDWMLGHKINPVTAYIKLTQKNLKKNMWTH